MKDTVQRLPPQQVVQAFEAVQHVDNSMDEFYHRVGKPTISCLAQGCVRLGEVWESAWKEGRGDRIESRKLEAIDRDQLKELYQNSQFIEAFRLKDPGFKTALESGSPDGEA